MSITTYFKGLFWPSKKTSYSQGLIAVRTTDAICPTGLTVSDAALSRRDKKITRLYEQGASKRRVGLYLARWLGWAFFGGTAAFLPSHCFANASAADGTAHHACLYTGTNASNFSAIYFSDTLRTDDQGDTKAAGTCSIPNVLNTFAYGLIRSNELSGLAGYGFTDGNLDQSFDNTAHANVAGNYIFKDLQNYCWVVTYNGAAYTAVAEATWASHSAYATPCTNITAPPASPTPTTTSTQSIYRVPLGLGILTFFLLAAGGAVTTYRHNRKT